MRRDFLAFAVVLAALTALLAVGISLLLTAFSSHDPKTYEPKDMRRGEHLERKHGVGPVDQRGR